MIGAKIYPSKHLPSLHSLQKAISADVLGL